MSSKSLFQLFIIFFTVHVAQAQVKAHLDSMMQSWIVTQSKKLNTTGSQKIITVFPDSIHSQRLAKLPVEFDRTFNEHIKKYVELYTIERRKHFEYVMGLTDHYFPSIEDALELQDLPAMLKYMAVAGSALNSGSDVGDGGTGLWHLSYPIAKRFGTALTTFVDGRKDHIASSTAAAQYLKYLDSKYNNWDMVIAAYFCGTGGIATAKNRSEGKSGLWGIYEFLPEMYREYIPAYIAAAYVMHYSEEFRLEAKSIKLYAGMAITSLDKKLHLKPISVVMGIPYEQLLAMNPTYFSGIAPANQADYPLTLPADKVKQFEELRDSIYIYQDSVFYRPPAPKGAPIVSIEPPPNSTELYYTVKSGDNLGYIAEWYNVGLSALRAWNGIEGDRINVGQVLRIYVPKSRINDYKNLNKKERPKSKPNPPKNKTIRKGKSKGQYIYYTVKSGESLWLIAKKFPGVSAENIMELNGIGTDLQPGQRLKIKPKE